MAIPRRKGQATSPEKKKKKKRTARAISQAETLQICTTATMAWCWRIRLKCSVVGRNWQPCLWICCLRQPTSSAWFIFFLFQFLRYRPDLGRCPLAGVYPIIYAANAKFETSACSETGDICSYRGFAEHGVSLRQALGDITDGVFYYKESWPSRRTRHQIKPCTRGHSLAWQMRLPSQSFPWVARIEPLGLDISCLPI